MRYTNDMAVVTVPREGIDVRVSTWGRVVCYQQGTGDVLLKFKGRAWPVAFPRASVAVLPNSWHGTWSNSEWDRH